MKFIMRGYIDKFILVYLDDVLVYIDNKDEHEALLWQVFYWLCEHKLQIKLKQCEFRKMHVKYLGHVVGSGKLCVDRNKVAAVSSWKPPTNIKGV